MKDVFTQSKTSSPNCRIYLRAQKTDSVLPSTAAWWPGAGAEAFPSCPHVYVPALCSRLPEDLLGMACPEEFIFAQVGEHVLKTGPPETQRPNYPYLHWRTALKQASSCS